MLLKFRIKNFKSFKDDTIFSLYPDRIKDISYSLLNDKYLDKDIKGLSGAVIYGPNAAGKTSIINAMSCFKEIILRGNINDSQNSSIDDVVSHDMKLIPFIFSNEPSPVEFEIEFIFENNLYDYELKMDLGLFAKDDYARKIVSEKLSINNYELFLRENKNIKISNLTKIEDLLLEKFDSNLAKKNLDVAIANLSDVELFLTSDFASYYSKKIVSNFQTWLKDYFIVVNKSNYKSLRPNIKLNDNVAMIDRNVNDIAKEAGIVGSDFGYIRDDNKIKLISFINKDGDKGDGLPSEFIESLGTLRLIGITPYILGALQNGGTLVMDELDSSIHPMIIMNIINAFHNNEINIKNAQLIFNTHNPIFLNSQLYRRDEIKFVEKNKDTKASILYSLSDFKTNSGTPVRNTTDYMKNYFVNRYGAIEDVDFSDVFERVVKGDLVNDNEGKQQL